MYKMYPQFSNDSCDTKHQFDKDKPLLWRYHQKRATYWPHHALKCGKTQEATSGKIANISFFHLQPLLYFYTFCFSINLSCCLCLPFSMQVRLKPSRTLCRASVKSDCLLCAVFNRNKAQIYPYIPKPQSFCPSHVPLEGFFCLFICLLASFYSIHF